MTEVNPSGLQHRSHARAIGLEYCEALLAQPERVHYTEGSDRWDMIKESRSLHTLFVNGGFKGDCSSTDTFILMHCLQDVKHDYPDIVNGTRWKSGFTGTMEAHGVEVHGGFLPMDAVFYYPTTAFPFEHTALLMDTHEVFSHGSEAGPFRLPMLYRPVRKVIRYI